MSLKKAYILLPIVSIFLYITFIRVEFIPYNPFNYINNYRFLFYAFIKNIYKTYFDLVNLNEENMILKKKLAYYEIYRHALLNCQNEARQNFYLTNSISLIDKSKAPYVYVSKIIGYDLSGKESMIKVYANKNIKSGDVVSSNGYFVGLVYKIILNTAYVMTVYNHKLNTIVYDYRTGDSYIYTGGYPYGKLINVNPENDVKVGDLIYFRSLKNNYTPYLLLGKVVSVEKTKNLFFLDVKVKPLAKPNLYDFVAIIGIADEKK